MKFKATLTANAGVILQLGNEHIFMIDALHDTPHLEFSSLTPEQVEKVFEYTSSTVPNSILVTHNHADHCDEALFAEAFERYGRCELLVPWAESQKKYRIYSHRDYSVAAIPLPHRYAPHYPEVENYGFVIDVNGKTVFTPGDAEPLTPEMEYIASNVHPDVALLPFLWVTLARCRSMLDRLAPKKLILFHLPFPDHDPSNYNHMTEAAVKRFYPETVIMNSFLQETEFEI